MSNIHGEFVHYSFTILSEFWCGTLENVIGHRVMGPTGLLADPSLKYSANRIYRFYLFLKTQAWTTNKSLTHSSLRSTHPGNTNCIDLPLAPGQMSQRGGCEINYKRFTVIGLRCWQTFLFIVVMICYARSIVPALLGILKLVGGKERAKKKKYKCGEEIPLSKYFFINAGCVGDHGTTFPIGPYGGTNRGGWVQIVMMTDVK